MKINENKTNTKIVTEEMLKAHTDGISDGLRMAAETLRDHLLKETIRGNSVRAGGIMKICLGLFAKAKEVEDK